MRTIVPILLVIGLVLSDCKASPAAIREKELTDSSIQAAWDAFDREKASLKVKGDFPFGDCFVTASQIHGVPLPLLLAVARGESNFDPQAVSPKAVSPKACYGIMQIQWPGTARDLGILKKKDLFIPCANINAGAKYLAYLLKRYHQNTYHALAAYHYGPGNIGDGTIIPEGARAYAAYIHENHLRVLLREDYAMDDRWLVLKCSSYPNALALKTYFEGKVNTLSFSIFKSPLFTYDLYLNKRRGIALDKDVKHYMRITGIIPLDSQ